LSCKHPPVAKICKGESEWGRPVPTFFLSPTKYLGTSRPHSVPGSAPTVPLAPIGPLGCLRVDSPPQRGQPCPPRLPPSIASSPPLVSPRQSSPRSPRPPPSGSAPAVPLPPIGPLGC